MTKKKMRTSKKPLTRRKKVSNRIDNQEQQGLRGALFGGLNFANQLGVGAFGGVSTEQLSNFDTLSKNLRWTLLSNYRQILSELYIEVGLVRTMVDIPVLDSVKGGITVSSKELDEEDIDLIQKEMVEKKDLRNYVEAKKWERLFGGGGLLIVTGQKAEEPLEIDNLDKDDPLEFLPFDMWEIFSDIISHDGDPNNIDDKLDYREREFYDYYAKKVHNSRAIIMKGHKAPSFIRPRLRGWGMSVVEHLVRSINQYLKGTNLGFEVLDEFKIDVYKIKNLANTLVTSDGTERIFNRIQTANREKSFHNAITMDSEDEYQQKQVHLAGWDGVMKGIRMQVASDLRMPMSKLFGISSAGFSSGEDDIENYNAMIEAEIRTDGKLELLEIVRLRCQVLFGYIPDDLSIEFEPLRELSSEQEQNVKNSIFNRALAARQAGEISADEFREICNTEKLFPIKVNDGEENFSDEEDEEDEEDEQDEPAPNVGGEDANVEGPKAKSIPDAETSKLKVKETPEAKK